MKVTEPPSHSAADADVSIPNVIWQGALERKNTDAVKGRLIIPEAYETDWSMPMPPPLVVPISKTSMVVAAGVPSGADEVAVSSEKFD